MTKCALLVTADYTIEVIDWFDWGDFSGVDIKGGFEMGGGVISPYHRAQIGRNRPPYNRVESC